MPHSISHLRNNITSDSKNHRKISFRKAATHRMHFMDMSNAYGKWVRENLPGVPVIYDHFHVIKAIKQACGYRDFKYFRLKVFDLPDLKPPRPHAARGRATFPRTAGFCARERRWSVPNHTTFTPPLGSLDVSGRGGRPRPPATAPQRDLRLIAVAGRRGRRPLPTL